MPFSSTGTPARLVYLCHTAALVGIPRTAASSKLTAGVEVRQSPPAVAFTRAAPACPVRWRRRGAQARYELAAAVLAAAGAVLVRAEWVQGAAEITRLAYADHTGYYSAPGQMAAWVQVLRSKEGPPSPGAGSPTGSDTGSPVWRAAP